MNCSNRFRCWLPGVAATAVALILFTASAFAAGRPAIRVSGGGVGEFLDPNPCDGFSEDAPFGESNYAVSATIHDDGTVEGNFMCQVKGCVVIVMGTFTEVLGIDRSDGAGDPDGVLLKGVGSFVDLTQEFGGPGLVMDENGVPITFEFCLELREGPGSTSAPEGATIGRFFYTDLVVQLGGPDGLGLDDGYDEEEIRMGHIMINFMTDIADIPFDRVEDCDLDF